MASKKPNTPQNPNARQERQTRLYRWFFIGVSILIAVSMVLSSFSF
jgi:predicted nucleic acid-binding Zn ribbon protein